MTRPEVATCPACGSDDPAVCRKQDPDAWGDPVAHPHGYSERRETRCCADPFHDRSRIVHDLDEAAEEERQRLAEDAEFDAGRKRLDLGGRPLTINDADLLGYVVSTPTGIDVWVRRTDDDHREAVHAALEEVFGPSKAATADYEADYEFVRDAVLEAFNPPDDGAAEPAIVTEAIELAAAYIARCPCECTEPMIEDIDACPRCLALGRLGDERVTR